MITNSIRSTLDRELHAVSDDILRLGSLVEMAIERSVAALKQRDMKMAQQVIDDYMAFYNYERIQLKTKLTPYERRCQSV